MRVKRDFDQVYATEADPWSIGDADSDRYDLYVERILAASQRRGSVLELGCGYGAMLARFRPEFEWLVGVELSALAVARARARFPFIQFAQGSLAHPDAALPHAGLFDTIIVSDVLYYLRERDRQRAVAWIAEHLAPGGLAFLAGWSPGGRYLTPEEFRNLARRELAIEREEVLETGHVVLCCRPLRTLVAMTVDYETWQPQLEGLVLDWEVDAFRPTARLLDVFDEADATLTIFAEMGEYLWLREHRPDIAGRMEEQWREAIRRGHDVQLHLHPNWLPEMGPTVKDGQWNWDMSRTRAAEYPYDLGSAIARAKAALEQAIRPVAPGYEVVAYRAGTYEAQPFDRLHDALVENGIWCDSSVLPGDSRPGRHYDYAHAYSDHQPWYAGRYDPQLKAPPAERSIVETPIFTPTRGERWTFDNEQGSRFAAQLLSRLARERRQPSSEALRRREHLRRGMNRVYSRLAPVRPMVNRVIPRSLAEFLGGYKRERLVEHRYFVLVAHTKTNLDFDAIREGLQRLRAHDGIELVSLTELARSARGELERSHREAPSETLPRDPRLLGRLGRLVPLDRRRILELDPSAGRYGDGDFDCVRAGSGLEGTHDIDATLANMHRVLSPGGCLVAAVTPDGLNPARTCEGHTWKTIAADVHSRLVATGFADIEIETVDIFRELGAAPFPPSRSQMLYVRAWKREPGSGALERIRELIRWVYEALDPARAQESNDPLEVLAGGHAWCWGYVLVLGEALGREGFELRWVTMIAEDHPLGLGDRRRDSHEVLEVQLPDGGRVVCDPMVGVLFEASLSQLLAKPSLADTPRPDDPRYRARNYAMYSTSLWYRLVRRVAVRTRPGARLRYVDARRVTGG